MKEIEISAEQKADFESVDEVLRLAFRGGGEASLVTALRLAAKPLVSLVAKDGKRVVGHVLFSPVKAPGGEKKVCFGLGPLAVHPDYQGRGIGARLVERGIAECEKHGAGAIFVLGNPAFYSRFGFELAAQHGLAYKDEQFSPFFMTKLLSDGALRRASGRVEYHAAFDAL